MSRVFDVASNTWETKFTCDRCGVPCDSAQDGKPTVCPKCCEDHDYSSIPDQHFCKHCGEQRAADYWDEADWDRP